jgi:hypothetical protein
MSRIDPSIRGHDHIDVQTDEFGRQLIETAFISVCGTVFDAEILAFRIAEVPESRSKRGFIWPRGARRNGDEREIPDCGDPVPLLGPRGEGPRSLRREAP